MIDITKKYKTRDGREVRIYAVDGAKPCPVHGAVKNGDEWSGGYEWHATGSLYSDRRIADADLIEATPERWHFVYEASSGHLWICESAFNSESEARTVGELNEYGKFVGTWRDPR